MSRTRTTILLLVACALLGSACGGNSPGSGNDKAVAPDAGTTKLEHLDGAVEVTDGQLTVTPASGTPQVMAIGPDVSQAELQAFASSGEQVRVYFEGGDADATALRVEKTPAASAGAKNSTGTITAVSASELTLESDSGTLTFAIRDKDAAAFEVAHLEQHKVEQLPIKVYYEVEGTTKFAVAYEDA